MIDTPYGLGLRWGVMGPSLQWHVGGGQSRIKHFMEPLMAILMVPLTGIMKALGTPTVTLAPKQTVVDSVMQESADRAVEKLAPEENEVLVGLLKLRAKSEAASVGTGATLKTKIANG